MSARNTLLRVAAGSRYITAITRAPGTYSVQRQGPGRSQKAWYAIPPLDKREDDLGGPYGQESPQPQQRKTVNRSIAGRAAMIIGLGLGFVTIFSVFASPRQLANHQIENDTVIGAPRSNTAEALTKVKRKDGVKTTHQLHAEQTGSTILGTK